MMTRIIKTYSELITLPTFEARFRYLQLNGQVCSETFGSNRYANQALYSSGEWKRFRDKIIIRDNGCDLGIEGRDIYTHIIIHHINPITYDDILNRSGNVFDPENVICTRLSTHNAIHYGDESLLISAPIERSKNDTCPWRQSKEEN